jgi:hypothetical protein
MIAVEKRYYARISPGIDVYARSAEVVREYRKDEKGLGSMHMYFRDDLI